MNIIDIQDRLKDFSEQQLVSEMQRPSGMAPQFLVLSEIQRRKRVRDDFTRQEASQQMTVAQEAVASAGVPQAGIAGMSEAMAPKSSMAQSGIGAVMKQPMKMSDGGVLQANEGAFFSGMSEEDIDLNDILDAIQSYESERGKTGFGSPPSEDAMSAIGGVGERSAYQIRPETLLDFGRGYESYESIFPEITARIGEGRDFANAFEAYKDPEIKSQVDEYLSNPDNARDAAMGILSSAYTETGDIDKAIMAYNAGLPGVLKGSQAGLPYLKGVKGQFDEMSDRRQFILGGISQAMGPMAIRGLGEQYYGKGDPIIDAALEERGYNPSAMAVVTTEPATSDKDVVTPTGEVILAGETIPEGTTLSQSEADKNSIPADATGGSIGNQTVVDSGGGIQDFSETDETEDDNDASDEGSEKETPTTPPAPTTTVEVGGDKPTYNVSSLEQQILNMEKELKKSRDQDKWLAIAQAGLAIMESDSPTLAGAIGEGGISGLTAFREAQERYEEGVIDLINARAKLKGDGNAVKAKEILDANIKILDNAMATPEERARARMIIDNIMSGSGYGLVQIPQQPQT